MAMNNALVEVFIGVIFLVIAITLITSFAPTIHDATDTTGALVNVSANAKTIYGFTDLIWAGGIIAFIAFGLFSIADGARRFARGK